jgi:putative lipoprotein
MSQQLHRLWLSFLVLLSLNACQSTDEVAMTSTQPNVKILAGNVYYHERKLLPDGTILQVALENISEVGAVLTQISSMTQTLEGTPPYAFNFSYDADLIKAERRYNLNAKLILTGKLLMMSTEQLDPFNPIQETINIKLSAVASAVSQEPSARSVEPNLAIVSEHALSTLTNTYWKLMTLNGEAVKMAERQKREAFFQLKDGQGIIKGFGSCNKFRGAFTVSGSHLSLAPIAATSMACVNGMTVEGQFFKVLEQTAHYSIRGHDLTLLDRTKQPLAHFHAQYFN